MSCPYCNSNLNKVVDKRSVFGSGEIRRRRECLKCKKRFTTYERLSKVDLIVIKRDGRREVFDKLKLRNGIARALEKRPGIEAVDNIADRIENKLRIQKDKEMPSKTIGKMVLNELKRIDKVAYLRFASVYRQFKDPEDFAKELTSLEK